MPREKLQLNRTSRPAPTHDIESAAEDIMDILKDFRSPRDAASVLTLAHYKMLCAAFPPGLVNKAIDCVEAEANILKDLLREGWD